MRQEAPEGFEKHLAKFQLLDTPKDVDAALMNLARAKAGSHPAPASLKGGGSVWPWALSAAAVLLMGYAFFTKPSGPARKTNAAENSELLMRPIARMVYLGEENGSVRLQFLGREDAGKICSMKTGETLEGFTLVSVLPEYVVFEKDPDNRFVLMLGPVLGKAN